MFRAMRRSFIAAFLLLVAFASFAQVPTPQDYLAKYGYHFGDERFVTGEYVSITEDGKMHTYRVVSASHL